MMESTEGKVLVSTSLDQGQDQGQGLAFTTSVKRKLKLTGENDNWVVVQNGDRHTKATECDVWQVLQTLKAIYLLGTPQYDYEETGIDDVTVTFTPLGSQQLPSERCARVVPTSRESTSSAFCRV